MAKFQEVYHEISLRGAEVGNYQVKNSCFSLLVQMLTGDVQAMRFP